MENKNPAAVALGSLGGKRRWAGRSKEEQKKHLSDMGKKSAEARRNKKQHEDSNGVENI